MDRLKMRTKVPSVARFMSSWNSRSLEYHRVRSIQLVHSARFFHIGMRCVCIMNSKIYNEYTMSKAIPSNHFITGYQTSKQTPRAFNCRFPPSKLSSTVEDITAAEHKAAADTAEEVATRREKEHCTGSDHRVHFHRSEEGRAVGREPAAGAAVEGTVHM